MTTAGDGSTTSRQEGSVGTMTMEETKAPAATAPETVLAKPSREKPFYAPVAEKRLLTNVTSSKSTVHLVFSTKGSGIEYEVGDSCGVIPQNDPRLVEEILQAAHLTGQETVQIPKAGPASLQEALLHHFVITKISRKMVDRYAQAGNCAPLIELLKPENQRELEEYVYQRGFIDLLEEFPGVVKSADEVIALLPKLTPRLYSISSSPLAHAGELHTTVAAVKYRTLERDRGGVCSTLMADRVSEGETLPIYIQQNKKFRLPQDMSSRLIMIGPGTGIAPFRAFLHERKVLGATGKNWLFFGERSAASDYLYGSEFEGMREDGHLNRLDLAFSRDQAHKIYVQDRMVEQGAAFWEWLQDGASVYVCGDANYMAKDVDAALHSIVEKHGEHSVEEAKEYVLKLKGQHRYHRDVY